MIKAIETYLATRRTVGFTLSNAEYLLRSFAALRPIKSKPTSAQPPPSNGLARPDRSRNDMSATRPCISLLSISA